MIYGDSQKAVLSRIEPKVLCTCRIFHREASPVLYGDNTFEFFLPEAGSKKDVPLRGLWQEQCGEQLEYNIPRCRWVYDSPKIF